MEASVPKVPKGACVRPPWALAADSVGFDLCAGDRGMVEVHATPCKGDSGGPLFKGNTVYGLVSRGDDSYGCGSTRSAVVYTSLEMEAGFINSVTSV
jgi:secreted trypsin-like serine protease